MEPVWILLAIFVFLLFILYFFRNRIGGYLFALLTETIKTEAEGKFGKTFGNMLKILDSDSIDQRAKIKSTAIFSTDSQKKENSPKLVKLNNHNLEKLEQNMVTLQESMELLTNKVDLILTTVGKLAQPPKNNISIDPVMD